ncbi:hypothetical protein SLA2020_423660 [Shorea laevis]
MALAEVAARTHFSRGQVDPSSRPQSQPLHSIETPPIPMSPAEVPTPRNPTQLLAVVPAFLLGRMQSNFQILLN